MNVAFVHPDLGLGGAERLVVDAATELRARGHRTVILTAHHDRARAFPETVDGSLDVRVGGRLVPGQIAGRLRAPCAIARTAALGGMLSRLPARPDVVVCDLVPHVIPLLRRRAGAPVVLYCHYPDRLLAPRTRGIWRWYRRPIDRLEELGTARADRVLVNSRFTAERLRQAFPHAAVSPIVVSPGVAPFPCRDLDETAPPGPISIVSVCRFDPQKNLGLAVDALAELRTRLPASLFQRVRLVLAGSVDDRLREQRSLVTALLERARRSGIDGHVQLRTSPSESERRALLSACRVVLYTPSDEHFGYAPIEAMAAGRPVVAVNAGGPAETVRDGETGFLCAPSADAFAAALARLLSDDPLAARLGREGRRHVDAAFSREAFGRRFEEALRTVVEERCSVR